MTEPLPGGLRFSTGEGTYTARGFIETSRRTLNVTEFFRRPRPPVQRRDPLAQSFTVDETGAFLTSLDVFFANKDENEMDENNEEPNTDKSLSNELEKLNALRESGVLTQEEFEKAKDKLLNN